MRLCFSQFSKCLPHPNAHTHLIFILFLSTYCLVCLTCLSIVSTFCYEKNKPNCQLLWLPVMNLLMISCLFLTFLTIFISNFAMNPNLFPKITFSAEYNMFYWNHLTSWHKLLLEISRARCNVMFA